MDASSKAILLKLNFHTSVSNVGHVNSITPSNEPDCNQVVDNELLIVLPGLFKLEDENKELLDPISKLHQVVSLH